MQHQKVRFKIFAASLLPTVLLSAILCFYLLNTRNNELDQLFLATNFSLIETLTPASQTYLANNQQEALQSLVTQTLEKPNIRSILIYDQSKNLMAQAGPAPSSSHPLAVDRLSQSKNIAKTSSSILFSQPINTAPWINSNHAVIESQPKNQKLGWIEIESYTLQNSLEKYKLFSITCISMLLTWFIHALIAFRASNRASDSMQSMYNAIIAIKEGKLNVRVKFQGIKELKKLELEFNAMSRSIRAAHHDLQLDVEQASQNVRETLETIEIQNIELDMARKEALEASRIKSEFLANMSHEIRTPLNGIIGFTKLLVKSNLTPRQQDHVNTIHKSSGGLLAIINDILDFSKIEAGKLELDHTPLNLREVVEEVLTILSPLAQEKKLEQISIIYSDVPVNLIGDPLRLKQIITNLVNNAIKFTEQGSIIVRVMLEDQRDQQVYIRVSVDDSGIGLSQGEQKNLFQAFNQGKSSKVKHYGGSGLGLVISKHLTEQMGGGIGLESKLGIGSTFWFTFRAERDSDNEELVDPKIFQHNRVALFDSNELVRLSLSHILQKAQIKHQQFSDLTALCDALETASQSDQPYVTALIGINHSHENNSALLKSIHKIEKKFNCRTLILTNTSDQTHYQTLLEQSSSAYLTKPIQFKKLLIALSNTPLSIQTENLHHPERFLYLAEPPKPLHKIKVLAVDDNATNLKLICALLDEMNINVVGCHSGQEAIELHEKNNYDLILMDVRMPTLDGIETTQLIRKNEPQNVHVPIIAVTAHAMANEKRKLLSQGMDDYVTKPINEKLLSHIINKWIPNTEEAPSPLPRISESNTSEPFSCVNQTESSHSFIHSLHQGQPQNLPIVDLTEGIRLAGGKRELAIEMLTMLFGDLEADKKAIIESSSDPQRLLDKVHHLHGATRYCGVPQLKFHANNVETLLKSGLQEKIEPALEAFLQVIEKSQKWWQSNHHTITEEHSPSPLETS